MNRLEDNVPALHDFGIIHDAVVGCLTEKGWPDLLANIPTMGISYLAAFYSNLWGDGVSGNSLGGGYNNLDQSRSNDQTYPKVIPYPIPTSPPAEVISPYK